MLDSAWLFVGRIAFAWTVLTLVGAIWSAGRGEAGDSLTIVSGTVGFVLWAVWTFGTLHIEVVTDSGSTVAFEHPALTLLGVALAFVPGYIALTGPIDMISNYRTVDPGEM